MKPKPLLIVATKTGYAVVELNNGELPTFVPERVQCFADLDHYSRSTTVIEAVKDHFKERDDEQTA